MFVVLCFAFFVVAPDKERAWFWYRYTVLGWATTPPLLFRFLLIVGLGLRFLEVHRFPGLAPLVLPIWDLGVFYVIVRYSMLGISPLLCDLMMPEVTGADLYSWLEDHHPHLPVRVLFLTGGACTPSTQDFIKTVRDRMLEKPVKPNVLRTHVRALLEADPSW